MDKHTIDKLEIHNKQIEKRLQEVGGYIKMIMPDGWEFMVMMFNYTEQPRGSLFYLSSVEREDITTIMKEFLRKQGKTSKVLCWGCNASCTCPPPIELQSKINKINKKKKP